MTPNPNFYTKNNLPVAVSTIVCSFCLQFAVNSLYLEDSVGKRFAFGKSNRASGGGRSGSENVFNFLQYFNKHIFKTK